MNNMRRPKTKIAVAVMALVCISSLPAMAANKLIVKDAAGTTDKFVVTDNGRIGVGTNAPTTAIQMEGNSATTLPQFRGKYLGTTANGGSGFFGMHNNDGNALPNAADRLGYFWFGAQNGTAVLIGAGATFKAESTWSTTSAPSYLTLDTTPEGSQSPLARVRVTSTGNVGIGTSTPTQKLEVNGGIRIATIAARPNCVSSIRGTLWFVLGATDTLYVCSQVNGGTPFWRTVTLN